MLEAKDFKRLPEEPSIFRRNKSVKKRFSS